MGDCACYRALSILSTHIRRYAKSIVGVIPRLDLSPAALQNRTMTTPSDVACTGQHRYMIVLVAHTIAPLVSQLSMTIAFQFISLSLSHLYWFLQHNRVVSPRVYLRLILQYYENSLPKSRTDMTVIQLNSMQKIRSNQSGSIVFPIDKKSTTNLASTTYYYCCQDVANTQKFRLHPQPINDMQHKQHINKLQYRHANANAPKQHRKPWEL